MMNTQAERARIESLVGQQWPGGHGKVFAVDHLHVMKDGDLRLAVRESKSPPGYYQLLTHGQYQQQRGIDAANEMWWAHAVAEKTSADASAELAAKRLDSVIVRWLQTISPGIARVRAKKVMLDTIAISAADMAAIGKNSASEPAAFTLLRMAHHGWRPYANFRGDMASTLFYAMRPSGDCYKIGKLQHQFFSHLCSNLQHMEHLHSELFGGE